MNLDSWIWSEGLDWVMLEVINRKKDLYVFNKIIQNIDSENKFIANIPELATQVNVSRVLVSKIIGKLLEINFLHKTDTRGIYYVNPFVIVARAMPAQKIEEKQKWWAANVGEPTTQTLNDTGKL